MNQAQNLLTVLEGLKAQVRATAASGGAFPALVEALCQALDHTVLGPYLSGDPEGLESVLKELAEDPGRALETASLELSWYFRRLVGEKPGEGLVGQILADMARREAA